jgi:hypothetical protein
MLRRLLSHLASFVAFVLFILGLPFLVAGVVIWGGNVAGAATDSIWFIKVAATFLGPFSTVLWYITLSHLIFHRRAGYFMQFVVFFGTIGVIYLLLANGVYHL